MFNTGVCSSNRQTPQPDILVQIHPCAIVYPWGPSGRLTIERFGRPHLGCLIDPRTPPNWIVKSLHLGCFIHQTLYRRRRCRCSVSGPSRLPRRSFCTADVHGRSSARRASWLGDCFGWRIATAWSRRSRRSPEGVGTRFWNPKPTPRRGSCRFHVDFLLSEVLRFFNFNCGGS